jgi:hypothetical protein
MCVICMRDVVYYYTDITQSLILFVSLFYINAAS